MTKSMSEISMLLHNRVCPLCPLKCWGKSASLIS